jgi:beta-glucanase (GH16 family)
MTFEDEFLAEASIVGSNSPWITGYPWGQTLLNELEYYTRYDKNPPTACDKGGQNHVFSSGTMSLVARIEPGNYEVWSWPGGNFTKTCMSYLYTSAMVYSKKKYLYGYFEIRAKIPHDGTVLWPAFWLWAGDGGYREIDVFEFGGSSPNTVGMNMHIEPAMEGGYVHSLHDSTPPYNNNYPGSYTLPGGPGVSQAFHTYSVRWSPNNVVWYVDGLPVYQQPGHAPPKDMYVIANLAIAPWAPYPVSSDFPASYEIDYIRVFRSLDNEMLWHWGNGGSGKLDWWNLNPGDQFVAGDFDGDGHDELLAISAATGFAHLMKYASAGWSTPWANNGSHTIHWWNLNPGDQFIAGDFDGDGHDELLAVSTGGWSHLMRYAASTWSMDWTNDGAWTIHLWHMRSSDRYLAGRFDTQRSDAELITRAQNGWVHVIAYDPLPIH